MAGLIVRAATRGDLPAIVAMLADDMLGQGREDASLPLDPRYGMAFDAIGAAANESLLVAVQGGAVVGCFQLTLLPGIAHRGAWRGQIESVRVASAVRGRGIGRQMIEWAIGRCRDQGCGTVQLTTNLDRADARRFYEGLGFTATHAGMKLAL